MRQQQSDAGAETETVHDRDGYFGEGSDDFSDMIGARFSAAVLAAVLAPFGRKFRQVAPGAIRHVAGPRGHNHRDRVIVAQLVENREQFPYDVSAQSVSLLRPIDRNLRHGVARFEDCKFAFSDHEFYPSTFCKVYRRITSRSSAVNQ